MKHARFSNTMAVWQSGQNWRKLPYAKGVWAGPFGRTQYLCDRDYRIIAYRNASGAWQRAFGESLRGYAMEEARYLWTPGQGTSPAVNAAMLEDLVARCSQHPATAWVIGGEAA